MAVALLAGVFYAIPQIVKALPRFGGNATKAIISPPEADPKPIVSLSAGRFETLLLTPDGEDSDENDEPAPPTPKPDAGDLDVTASNLCWYELGESPSINLINRTKLNIDLQDYLKREFPIKGDIPNDEPLVLIIHTHGTESYLDSGYDFYSPSETFRSEEEADSVVHIGAVLTEALEAQGIPVLHDRTMYDKGDYSHSYGNSKKGIQNALAKHPSIRFVIDLHRDSVFDSNGNNIKPLTEIDGKKCAQLMLVMGTNQSSVSHPSWKSNLTFATYLQSEMNDLYPTLARPINLRTAAFNQQLTLGSILLEVGSCGNTIEEAENAVRLFADAYANVIKENMT